MLGPSPQAPGAPVVRQGSRQGERSIDKLAKLKRPELDVAFLEWLSSIHHDTDPELKSGERNSITAGNEHLEEAHELLAKK